jgi:hypothetical protein
MYVPRLLSLGEKQKEKEKERRQCKHYRHGIGKDAVFCSAPSNGYRDTQHPTWRIKNRSIPVGIR